MVVGVTFFTFALAIHIAAVVIAFGVTFAYPVMYAVGVRTESRSMPGFHRIQDKVGKFVISPFLGLALLAGIYLASKLHSWSDFYVQWGLTVIVILGALGGAYFAPKERRLAELAEQEVAAAPPGGQVEFGAEYTRIRLQMFRVNLVANVLILLTIYFMTAQTGA
ncbi:MAG TPA: hypothetical protein VL988_11215 [Solirubrobacteraceae bacterium]|nr:hypothetical protein [Solirubrobacteraceae bacterium]